jgi:hypothetical protein
MQLFFMKFLAIFVFVLFNTNSYAEGSKVSAGNNAKWKEECSSCHIAFPPQFLTDQNWQQLMGGLEKHFGANAALDAKDNKEILEFLQRNAGSGNRHSATSLRITDTTWFTREHREVSSHTWSVPAVKSRSNCTACHVNAQHGDWSERGIRMPGGLSRGDDD